MVFYLKGSLHSLEASQKNKCCWNQRLTAPFTGGIWNLSRRVLNKMFFSHVSLFLGQLLYIQLQSLLCLLTEGSSTPSLLTASKTFLACSLSLLSGIQTTFVFLSHVPSPSPAAILSSSFPCCSHQLPLIGRRKFK